MDLIDRLLGHDAFTTGLLLDIAEGLSDEQLDRAFDIGPGTVRATLAHVIYNTEVWSALMAGAGLPAERPGAGVSIASIRERHERASAVLASVGADTAARDAWDETWTDVLDDPPREKTYGGALGHVLTHSMHHRAQLLNMLRRLGVRDLPEGDLLSWERAARGDAPR